MPPAVTGSASVQHSLVAFSNKHCQARTSLPVTAAKTTLQQLHILAGACAVWWLMWWLDTWNAADGVPRVHQPLVHRHSVVGCSITAPTCRVPRNPATRVMLMHAQLSSGVRVP
jgi:hypothetical protein